MKEITPKTRLRRDLGRVGWGLLLFFLGTQLIPAFVMRLPWLSGHQALSYILGYICIYGISPLLLLLLIHRLPKGESPGLPLSPRALGRAMVFSLGMSSLANYVTLGIITLMETTGLTTGNPMEAQISSLPFWLNFLIAGVSAPICEELIFRKLLLDRLRPMGDRAAIWISGVAFGLFHMNLYQFFYATLLGLIFAGIVLKTGKLYHSILLHAGINISSLLLGQLTPLAEENPAVNGLIGMLGIGILACVGYSIHLFSRYYRTYRHDPPTLPFTTREVLLTLPKSVGVWVLVLASLAGSIAIIFLSV